MIYVNDFIDAGQVKKVFFQSADPFRMLPENTNYWHVRNNQGQMMPFSSFSTTPWKYNSPRLERYNGFPSMKIQGQSAPTKSTGDALALMQELAKKLPNGISVRIGVAPLSGAYVC